MPDLNEPMNGMHRVYVAPEILDESVISLPHGASHHVARVLRLRVGDQIGLFDGSGREYLVCLTLVSAGQVRAEKQVLLAAASTRVDDVVLGQGLPQGAKMDWIVEKCSELGLSTLVPLDTELSVVRSASQQIAGKMARWQRIAAAAAGQSGRRTLLELGAPSSISDFCARYGTAPVKIICWEHEKSHGIRRALETGHDQYPVAVLVGPEKGLTENEVAVAMAHGFVPVSLGPQRLRAETAAVIVTGIIRYSRGELDP
ncbi:MAG: 16S rRNA (uracil(1498)-N(3))-methyltransferase [Candidatus Tectomicrobia bacterium]|nr:16S rRNA (uracil(1498)-N(3))-methyltransferase [Candidatus Tectomicrobia bacterium]